MNNAGTANNVSQVNKFKQELHNIATAAALSFQNEKSSMNNFITKYL